MALIGQIRLPFSQPPSQFHVAGSLGNATLRGLSKLLVGRGNMDPETAAKVAQILVSEDPSFVMRALSAQTNTRAGQQAFDQLMSRAFRAVRGGTAALGAAAGSQAITSGQ